MTVHKDHREEFLKKFKNYSLDDNNYGKMLFSINDIEDAIKKLKKGKAAGEDNVSVEHVIFAHPCLIASLKILFNLMFTYGFVPDDFGMGIMIPLLKNANSDVGKVDNYRGITLSCVFSKIFKYAILAKFNHLFIMDSLQFGFKKV